MLVLFVDDDALNRRVVRDMLSVAGVSLDEADDGESGLRCVDALSYDLVLMDLRMPGMDGLTAIGHIRSRTDHKAAVPIVVVTADTGLRIRDECLGAGADDLMLKPVAMGALFETIGRVLAKSNQGGSLLS